MMNRRRRASRATDPQILAAQAHPAGLGMLDRSPRRFQFPPHLQILDRALTDIAEGRNDRLIVEMPPRHGKSMEASELFPAWFLGRYPDKRIILASYGATLAKSFGRKARDLLKIYGPHVYGIEIDPAQSAAEDWGIKGRHGGMVTVGVGGGITGKGADILIIDDPVKNHEEAQSELQREKVWDWYTSTAYTRLEPDGAVIIIQTRWHEDDLAGRAQLQEDEGWRVIRMPAICDDAETDPLGRAEGEPLWPRRYHLKRLRQIAKSVGTYVWNALYQQSPVAAEGNVLKKAWWKRYEGSPRDVAKQCDEIIQSWDMAFKDSDGSDSVAGQVWGRRGADVYFLASVTAVLDYPGTREAVRGMVREWPEANAKLVEDKANGSAIIADLKREIPGLIAVEPQGGKMARVVAISAMVEAGNVHLPSRAVAPWIDDFIAECASFPNGKHDDQVDAMSQALLRLQVPFGPETAPSLLNGAAAQAPGRAADRRAAREAAYWGDDGDEDSREPLAS
ncbi:MAG: phage uncharacterized protein [Thermoleophilia bacterium]|nr:phage uncharacterized protein [Thermoleophilia bacterium]